MGIQEQLAESQAQVAKLQAQIKEMRAAALAKEEESGPTKTVTKPDPELEEKVKSLESALSGTQKLAGMLQRSYAEAKKASDEAKARNAKIKAQLGLSFEPDGVSPYLVNMSDDPLLAGAVMYQLSEGKTVLGATAEGQNGGAVYISLRGIGVDQNMVQLERDGSTVEAVPQPVDGAFPRVLVNGVRLKRRAAIAHGDRIIV